MKDMKSITFYGKAARCLHIEIPHAIINIRVELKDLNGKAVESIQILPDIGYLLDGAFNNCVVEK